jgi:hypothetical protein
MSDTKLKLTEKQRLWANAFLKAMGEQSQIDKVEVKTDGKQKTSGLKGKLSEFEGFVEHRQREDVEELTPGISGEGEDISREKKSLDLRYKKKVVKPVNELLESADKLIKEGKLDSELETLRQDLQERYSHYFKNLQGEDDDDKGEQRGKKMVAIKDRIDAIMELQQKLKESGEQERTFQVDFMTEGEQSKSLKENPEILKGMVAKEPDVEKLAKLMSAKNWGKVTDDIVFQLGGMTTEHEEYMVKLAKQLLLNRSGSEKVATIFRESSSDILLPFEIGKQTKEGQAYLNDLMKDRDLALGKLPPLPKPPPSKKKLTEVEINEQRLKQEIAESEHIQNHWDGEVAKFVLTTLVKIMKTELPKPFLETVLAAADVARQVGHQNPSELVCTAVLLRYVNPALTNKKIETGKVSPSLEGDVRDQATMATKALQNIANQTTPQQASNDWKNYPKLLKVVTQTKGLAQKWAQSIWDYKRREFGYE